MTRRPDFDELVGDDLDGAERERLLRVHELLIEAGPPPSAAPAAAPPVGATVYALPRRAKVAALALAAALAAAAFALGFLVSERTGGPGTFEVIPMTGTAQAQGATADIELYDIDEAGNWPMELRVRGLRPPESGNAYELWLTKGDRLVELCGTFLAEPDGTTVVPMNAPYKLLEFDEWVVVEEGSETPLLTT
jgi:hypothetical protein